MIRERVAVGSSPTRICHSGVLLENTGDVDVVVDVHEGVHADGPTRGLKVAAGQLVTVPRMGHLDATPVYAIAPGGGGELTYIVPAQDF